MTFDAHTILGLLESVTDPEIPVLSILDLGIVREVMVKNNGELEIVITPTYTGCPAMNTIEWDIRATLMENGLPSVKITTVLAPAWTTDWMSEKGKRNLKEYGIAPPMAQPRINKMLFAEPAKPECPHCGSTDTEMVSEFGSTACKALYRCKDCQEPFDYFKCH